MIDDSKTICLTDDDTVEGIAEKIKNSAESEINLVAFSHRSPVLSVVNLKLFKKIADSVGKSLLVSTNDDAVKILADKSGVSCNFLPERGKSGHREKLSEEKPSVDAADIAVKGKNFMQTFNRSRKSVDSVGFGKGFSREPSFTRRPIASNDGYSPKKISEFSISGGSKKILAVFLILAAAVAGAAAYIILPTSAITITPKTQPLNANFEFILNKNIIEPDKANKEIPATIMVADTEKSGQFTATGRKQVSAKATGIVTVYNECSTTPRSLKNNNSLVSISGKEFFTTQSITIPGMIIEDGVTTPGSIDVPIVAAKAGAEYNIDPTSFTFTALRTAKCQKITARSAVPTSGGALGYATVVSESDLQKAKDFLENEAKKDLVVQLDAKKPADLVLVPDAVSLKSEKLATSVKADQIANKFQASLKTSAIAFLFNPSYATAIAKDIFAGIGQEKNNYVILDPYEINYSSAEILSSDEIKLSAEAKSTAYQAIDTGKIKSALLGKSKEEVEDYIKNNAQEVDSIKITLWPFWVQKVPILERNVTITVLLDNETAK